MQDFSKFDEVYLASKKVYSEKAIDLPESTPQSVRSIYERYGLASFGNGFLWIIDPLAWQEHYLPWFESIERREGYIDSTNTYPFIRTAFGDVIFFCGKYLGFVSISTGTTNSLNMNFYLNVSLTESDGLKDLYFFEIFKSFSSRDTLNYDECLGFIPPLILGGVISEEGAHKVKLKEHLAFLSEFIDQTRDDVYSI